MDDTDKPFEEISIQSIDILSPEEFDLELE
jgi:hypothetical protein